MIDVQDNGIIADGSTPISTALQNLFDSSPVSSKMLFKKGYYKFDHKVVNAKNHSLIGEGAGNEGWKALGGTYFEGTVPDWLIQYPSGVGAGGPNKGFSVRDIQFVNGSTDGGGILIEEARGPVDLSGLDIRAWKCINLGMVGTGGTFSVGIQNPYLRAPGGGGPGSYGIAIAGHTEVNNPDIVGFERGLIGKFFFNLNGGRFERNLKAIVVGHDLVTEQSWPTAGVVISGTAFEANDVSIYGQNVNGAVIQGVSIWGSQGSPSGNAVSGLDLRGTNFSVQGSSINGYFTNAAIKAEGIPGYPHISFISTKAENQLPGGTKWDLANPQDMALIATNYS